MFRLILAAMLVAVPCFAMADSVPVDLEPIPAELGDLFGRGNPDQPATPTEPPKFDFPGDAPPAQPQEPGPAPFSPQDEGMSKQEKMDLIIQIIMLLISAFGGAGILGGLQLTQRRKRVRRDKQTDLANLLKELVDSEAVAKARKETALEIINETLIKPGPQF